MALTKCPHCGAHISDKAHRCPKCGGLRDIQLTNDTPVVSAPVTQPSTVNFSSRGAKTTITQPRNKKSWFIIGGCVAVIVIAILGYILLFNSPKNTPKLTESQTEASDNNVDLPIVEAVVGETGKEVVEEEVAVATDNAEYEKEEADTEFIGMYIDEPPTIQGTFKLTGKIDEKYDIQVWLTVEGNKIDGKYCYNSTLKRYGDQPSSYINFKGLITCADYFKIKTSSSNTSETSIWDGHIEGNRLFAEKNLGTGEIRTMEAYIEP